MWRAGLIVIAMAHCIAGSESGAEVALELWDVDKDGSLTENEVDALILSLTGGESNVCPTAHELFEESGVTGNATSHQEIAVVLSNLYPCIANKLFTASKVTAVVQDEHYECVVSDEHGEGDDHHDEHDGHDHRRVLASDNHDGHDHGSEEQEVLVEFGTKLLSCSKEEESGSENQTIAASVWGYALLATFLVSLSSLSGIALIVCFRSKLNTEILNDAVAFAVGVLLSTVFIHAVPEGVEGAKEGYSWKFGATLLGGVFCSFAIELASSMLGSHGHHHDLHDLKNSEKVQKGSASSQSQGEKEDGSTDVSDLALEDGQQEGTVQKKSNVEPYQEESVDEENKSNEKGEKVHLSLVTNVVIGDAFHNLVDGMLIGTAFSVCDESSLGWIVTAAILCHEVPQELVDFLVLVRAGLSFKKALLFNFLSSLAAFLGCIIVLAVGANLNSNGRAMLLAFSSGFLVYIALSELLPTLVDEGSSKRKLFRFVLTVLGVCLIGLLQLFHFHC